MKAFVTFLGMMLGLALLVGGYFLFKYVVGVFDTLGAAVKETVFKIGVEWIKALFLRRIHLQYFMIWWIRSA